MIYNFAVLLVISSTLPNTTLDVLEPDLVTMLQYCRIRPPPPKMYILGGAVGPYICSSHTPSQLSISDSEAVS